MTEKIFTKLRIAFAIRDRKNFIGGPAADAVRLLIALRDRGHDMHVLGFWVGKEKAHAHLDALATAGIPCRIIRRQTFSEDGVHWILEQIKEIRPDIFIAGLSTEGCFTAHWLIPAGIPVVNVCYGNDEVNLGRSTYFSVCPAPWRVSGHLVFGTYLMQKLIDLTHTQLPVHSISGVVELPDVRAGFPNRPEFGIVYAGRLVEDQKRTGDVIRAFIRLATQNAHFRFHVIGDSVGDERMQYEQVVRENHMQERIIFHGILYDKPFYDELAKHQVIVLLSDSEGIPGAVIDGMAAGLVPVCLRYPGVKDLIIHGETGLIVENRTSDFEQAILRLSTNPQLWHEMSTRARNHIATHFNKDIIIDKWETILQSLISNAGEKQEFEVPRKIRLPRKTTLLLEDRRRPSLWQKILRKFPRLIFPGFVISVLLGCWKDESADHIATDKDVALHYLEKQFIQKPFDTYHLDRVPDTEQCMALLGDNGIFADQHPEEQRFLQSLDSFYTVESASFYYSRFIVHNLSRLWKIAEGWRGSKTLHADDKEMMKLLNGIIHYGSLELNRPGNRFQHKYSDFHTSTIAINIYFCLYPLMEEVRKGCRECSDIQKEVYHTLAEIGLQSWTVPQKFDATDISPIQLSRFSGHTWWVNGNALEFRPIYPCALMMHSAEMVDIVAILVDHAISEVSPRTADTSFWRENITPDGGAWSYGRQNRPWAYSFRGLRAAVQRMSEFKGTPWEIPMTPDKARILLNFIRGSSFFHYKGFIPPCLDRQNFNIQQQTPGPIPSIRLAELVLTKFPHALSEDQRQELSLFIEHASVEEQTAHVEFDSAYFGTRYYYSNDDLISKTQDYYVYVNMASRRVDGVESAVQYADVHNYFGADGATFFMRSGDEYHKAMGAFELTSHPGVTARYGDDVLVPGRNLMGHCSIHDFVAGVVSAQGACAGFIFEKMRGMDKYRHWGLEDTLFENDQEWLYGVQAYKSYFWFGDQLVALGCGIANRKPDLGSEIHTTIDQSLSINTRSQNKSLKPGDSELILVKARNEPGNVPIPLENNGFVYRILPDQTPGEVWLQVETRPTRWDELNILNRELNEKSQKADIFQLWINHGTYPRDDRYGYSVYCGRGEAPPVPRVLINSTRMQAMTTEDGSHVQAIFFETDTLKYDGVFYHVSASCAFSALRKGDTLTLTVSDAKMDTSLDTIVVTTNLPIAYAPRMQQFYQVAIELPKGKYRGKQTSEHCRVLAPARVR